MTSIHRIAGVPLDGIGFQAHFYLGTVPATIQQNLQRFADLGLDVAITEVDINMRGPGNATALAQQAKDYHAIVSACVAVERCIGIVSIFSYEPYLILNSRLDNLGYHGQP